MAVTGLCYAALILRLWRIGVAAKYRCLITYLATAGAGDLIFAPLSLRSWAYVYWYMATTPILWVAAYLAVLEMCHLILEDYPGVASAGRKLVTWTMSVTLVVATVVAATTIARTPGMYHPLRMFFVLHISVRTGLLLFLILVQAIVYRFRLDLPRNRRLLAFGYVICWGLDMAADLISAQVSTTTGEMVDAIQMSVCSVLLLTGCFLLSRAGEERQAAIHRGSSDRRDESHRRLAEMNRLLSDAVSALKGEKGKDG